MNRHNFFIGAKRESCEIDFLDWFFLFSILVILYTAKTKKKTIQKYKKRTDRHINIEKIKYITVKYKHIIRKSNLKYKKNC